MTDMEALSEMIGNHQYAKLLMTCHDCKKDVDIMVTRTSPTELEVEGGALYKKQPMWVTNDPWLCKCDECFKKDRKLHPPILVYSRVVGYMSPTSNWNDSKRAEFGMRKKYKIDGIEPMGS